MSVERRVTFDRDQVARYAAASGDRNPIHLDDAVAKSVGLPGVIVHGMLQMAVAAGVAVEALGGDPRRLASLSVRFAGMVEPGEEVVFTATERGEGSLELGGTKADGTAFLTKGRATAREPGAA